MMKGVIADFSAKRYDAALAGMNRALQQSASNKTYMSDDIRRTFIITKGHILLAAGREREALQTYSSVVDAADDSAGLFARYEVYGHLRNYFARKGDKAKSDEYRLKEYETKDKLINRSHTISLEGSRAIYQQEKLSRSMARYLAESRFYRIICWIAVVFLTVVIALLVWLYLKFSQLRRSRNIIAQNDREFFRKSAEKQIFKETDTISTLASEEEDENRLVYDKVMKVIETNPEIYEEDFNTGRLADLIGEKPTTILAAVSEATGLTTTQFLARTRIREACRRINTPEEYGDYTLEAIGQSVGYRSRSHFGAVFKRFVGMTPSEYAAKIAK